MPPERLPALSVQAGIQSLAARVPPTARLILICVTSLVVTFGETYLFVTAAVARSVGLAVFAWALAVLTGVLAERLVWRVPVHAWWQAHVSNIVFVFWIVEMLKLIDIKTHRPSAPEPVSWCVASLVGYGVVLGLLGVRGAPEHG